MSLTLRNQLSSYFAATATFVMRLLSATVRHHAGWDFYFGYNLRGLICHSGPTSLGLAPEPTSSAFVYALVILQSFHFSLKTQPFLLLFLI